nr:M20/M25/M40 family metallo-hydrolase [uncultured Tessaracoccus sp.]
MTWNAPAPTQIVRELATKRWPDKVISEPAMLGGEDFAAFSRTAPSTYVFVGAGNAEKGFDSSHHSPTFGLDEDAFPIALQLVVDVLRNAEALAAAERD